MLSGRFRSIQRTFTLAPAFVSTTAGGTVIPLPPGASYGSVGYQSINNNGVVVGYSTAGGWIWDATNGTRLLNGLVPAGWTILGATNISNNGLILAVAVRPGQNAGENVELVPPTPATTPAPATWLLVILGLGFVAALARWAAPTSQREI